MSMLGVVYKGGANGRRIGALLRDTFYAWNEDKAPRLGAALAYYSVFSLAPLLVIAIAIAAMAFGEEAARGQVVHVIDDWIGKQGAEAVQDMLKNARQPGAGILATAMGVATLLLGASGVFGALKDSLNTIWGVVPKPGASIWVTLKERFWSVTMVLGVGFLLMVSLILSAALTALGSYASQVLPGGAGLWQWLNNGISFLVISGLFALMFKYLPDARVAWRDVWIGSALTGALFIAGKYLLGLYIGMAGVGSPFGAAGSLVVVLIWVYYSAQILFFGAEFTKVYANRYGESIQPEANAMLMSEASRISQGIPTQPGSVNERLNPRRPEQEPVPDPSPRPPSLS